MTRKARSRQLEDEKRSAMAVGLVPGLDAGEEAVQLKRKPQGSPTSHLLPQKGRLTEESQAPAGVIISSAALSSKPLSKLQKLLLPEPQALPTKIFTCCLIIGQKGLKFSTSTICIARGPYPGNIYCSGHGSKTSSKWRHFLANLFYSGAMFLTISFHIIASLKIAKLQMTYIELLKNSPSTLSPSMLSLFGYVIPVRLI
jgi:hypothetical protein